MRLEDLIQRVDLLIRKANEIIQTVRGDSNYVDSELFYAFRSSSLSFLAMTFGKDHTHYDEFTQSQQEKLYDASIRPGFSIGCAEGMAVVAYYNQGLIPLRLL